MGDSSGTGDGQRLLQSLATGFEPAKYRDHYRENLRALIDAKIRGEELTQEEARPMPIKAPDILEALKASLESVAISRTFFR